MFQLLRNYSLTPPQTFQFCFNCSAIVPDLFQSLPYSRETYSFRTHYDSKIEHYRTPIVNDVIGCVAQTSKVLEEIKKPDSLNLLEKSGLVPYGLDLSNLLNGFQALRELMNSTRSHFRL
jgi:hypothetical protein